MAILYGIALMVALVVLPFAMFAGVVGLAVLIWSWGRIGRYFINFGRWVGDWRNFIPLTILGTFHMVVLLLLTFLLLPQLKMLWIILLVLHAIVTMAFLNFAMIAWTIWFCQWFWPKYRRRLWGVFTWLFGRTQRPTPRRAGEARSRKPKPQSKPPPGEQPLVTDRLPSRRSWLGGIWALMLGKPTKPTRAQPVPGSGLEPGTPPPKKKAPVKRSWFVSLWALMLGKPSKPAKPKSKTKPVTVQTTEQSLGQSESMAATAKTVATTRVVETSTSPKANKKAPPKRSGLGAFWALMLGKRSRSGKPKPGPAAARTSDQETRPSETAAAATAKTGATARAAEPTATPERAKKERPAKRGFLAGMWTSIIRGVTFVVGLVFLAVVWVVQKIREGIEWIRVRLNLD